jgi:hypothetical protein
VKTFLNVLAVAILIGAVIMLVVTCSSYEPWP